MPHHTTKEKTDMSNACPKSVVPVTTYTLVPSAKPVNPLAAYEDFVTLSLTGSCAHLGTTADKNYPTFRTAQLGAATFAMSNLLERVLRRRKSDLKFMSPERQAKLTSGPAFEVASVEDSDVRAAVGQTIDSYYISLPVHAYFSPEAIRGETPPVLSCDGFAYREGSGINGLVYISKKDFLWLHKRLLPEGAPLPRILTRQLRNAAEALLRGLVEDYNSFLHGEVYDAYKLSHGDMVRVSLTGAQVYSASSIEAAGVRVVVRPEVDPSWGLTKGDAQE